jgi:cell division protein FtsZ
VVAEGRSAEHCRELTTGLGAGGNPDIGCKAAEDHREEIEEVLGGADMGFVTVCRGCRTCAGRAPVIANMVCSLGEAFIQKRSDARRS